MFYDDPITSLQRETEQRLLDRQMICANPASLPCVWDPARCVTHKRPEWVKRTEANALVPKELA